MPANLTPEYEKAELRFRQAATDEERVAALEEMLAVIPKHKGTEKMQADLKRRLSQLRRAEQRSGHGEHKGPDPFHIPRSGAGQVVLIGPPNTGKSSLLAATTHAEAKIGDYPFTTVVPQPGMWQRDDVQIELVDTPAVTADHVPTGLMGTIRNADVVCVVVEAGETALEQIEETLGALSARGVSLRSVPCIRRDPVESNLQAGLILLNKVQRESAIDLPALRGLYPHLKFVVVNTRDGIGLEDWFRSLWDLLARVRVYAKEPGKAPDLHKPFVLPLGATVADLARQIHRDLPDRMRYARLWGHSRFEGQQVHKTEPLRDRDVVEIHE